MVLDQAQGIPPWSYLTPGRTDPDQDGAGLLAFERTCWGCCNKWGSSPDEES